MPFTWRINIDKTPAGYAYNRNPLNQVAVGDEIIWTNNDDRPHWPALLADNVVNQTYFMPYQIPPGTSSTTFVANDTGTFTYVDALDQTRPRLQGSIIVTKTGTVVESAGKIALSLIGVLFAGWLLGASPVEAQTPEPVACPAQQQELLNMPQIRSSGGYLRGTVKITSTMRTLWGSTGDPRCASQDLRVLQGYSQANPQPWPTGNEPLPGPTLRARIGDQVQLTFLNQVNPSTFAASLDRSAVGTQAACDQYTPSGGNTKAAGGDEYPNCLHGSSTSNLHFHGTHTTPSTTGDNILMFVRPALRINGQVLPADSTVQRIVGPIFQQCQANGPPSSWSAMPSSWTALQQNLLQLYDRTAVYQGKPGALPASMQLWPANQSQISHGLWPQYSIGAFPYCFPLPAYDSTTMRMGQAPGTHWYHAHKHGSTALNVANGLTGAFIIEGPYDDQIRRYYGPALVEQVLMIQQLSSTPFPLTSGTQRGPGAARPQISVNGRLNPIVAMKAGEVQWWRVINGSFRDAVQFAWFLPSGNTQCGTSQPPASSPVQWRQIAQDGVQFDVANYNAVGTINNRFNLSPANRADLLVKAPTQAGTYTLCIVRNAGLYIDSASASPSTAPDAPSVMLTVRVSGPAVNPAMSFMPNPAFPTFPTFLKDIADSEIVAKRQLVFGPGNSTINGQSFSDSVVNQTMQVNTAEEWTVMNQANDKAHPFHIHINPFQVTATFEPNRPEANDPNNPCYVDNNNPATWVPCAATQPKAPFVWWDTFGIPTGRQVAQSCTTLSACPPQLQKYIQCNSGTCTLFIPGWFRMRSRFVDYTGEYVLHCHILIHEDRGMMQLIQVVPGRSGYSHH